MQGTTFKIYCKKCLKHEGQSLVVCQQGILGYARVPEAAGLSLFDFSFASLNLQSG